MSMAPYPRLRIVHVSDCYTPRLGGIEVQVADLARQQTDAGHHVHVITSTAAGGPQSLLDRPRVLRLTAPVSLRPFSYEVPLYPRAVHDLRRLFAELQPDVVHVHVGAGAPFSWAAARCATGLGLPVVATVHSMWDLPTRSAYRVLATVFRWTRWPMLLAPVSTVVAQQISQVTGGRVPMVVVPNGIGVDDWLRGAASPEPSPEPLIPGRPVRVMAVGRLAPRKRVLPLLRVLRVAALRIGPSPGLRVRIVGDGPAEPAIRRYLRDHRMTDWVSLLGRLERHELPSLLASADVFIAPASREAFGLAALEARVIGLPVVARTGTGVVGFVAHERNGLLAADDDGLVDSVVRLAADPSLRQQISATNLADPPSGSDWNAVLSLLDRCYSNAADIAAGQASACTVLPARTE